MKLLLGANDSHALKSAEFAQGTDSGVAGSEYEIALVRKFPGATVRQIVALRDGHAALVSSNDIYFTASEAVVACDERVAGLGVVDGRLLRVLASGRVDVLLAPDFASAERLLELPALNACAIADSRIAFVTDSGYQIVDLNTQDVLAQGTVLADSVVAWCGDHAVFGTRAGEVIAVDALGSRRALKVSKDAIKSVGALDGATVAAGDARGMLAKVAVAPLKLLGLFKGVQGSTRAIAARGSVVAAGGLDRYVRVFDVASRKLLSRVYTGDVVQALCIAATDAEQRDRADDDMWDAMAEDPSDSDASSFHGFDD